MPSSFAQLLEDDHRRLDALLDRAVADPEVIDRESYDAFRAGLLRHIGIEEKLVMPSLRAKGGDAAALAAIIREEHSAIALLLVPPPTHALVGEIRSLLVQHNPREEGDDGLYSLADRLLGDELEATLQKAEAYPPVPPAPYRDGPRVHYTAASALAYARGKTARAGG